MGCRGLCRLFAGGSSFEAGVNSSGRYFGAASSNRYRMRDRKGIAPRLFLLRVFGRGIPNTGMWARLRAGNFQEARTGREFKFGARSFDS